MRTLAVFLSVLLAPVAFDAPAASENEEHYQAAVAFYEAARLDDPEALGTAIAQMVQGLHPALEGHEKALEDYVREILQSDDYADTRVRIYMDLFSRDELESLTWLFKHSAYQRYREVQVELVQRNTQATMHLFQDRIPDLQRRINEGVYERRKIGDK